MTTSGDMVKYQSGARARLGIGSANQLLQVKSSLPSWETVDLADTVLTVAGDVLFENSTPELARLPKGNLNDVLTMGSALPAWSAPSGGAWTSLGSDYQDGAVAELEVTFTSMDLLYIQYAIQNSATAEPLIRTNDDSGSGNYMTRKLKGTGEVDTTTSGITVGQSGSNAITEGQLLIWNPDPNASYTGARMVFYGHNLDTSATQTSNVFLGGCNNDSTTDVTSIQAILTTGDTQGSLKIMGFDY